MLAICLSKCLGGGVIFFPNQIVLSSFLLLLEVIFFVLFVVGILIFLFSRYTKEFQKKKTCSVILFLLCKRFFLFLFHIEVSYFAHL